MKKLVTPLDARAAAGLRAGEEVVLSGTLYTARDQAHRRMAEALKGRRNLPIALKGQVIYYCGPTPAERGKVIGACGPTTSARMDRFTPALLCRGLRGMIGKGRRCPEVIRAIRRHKAVYFVTYAGCGALLSGYVKRSRRKAYHDLGPEAVYELTVEEFPLIVAVDSRGRSIL